MIWTHLLYKVRKSGAAFKSMQLDVSANKSTLVFRLNGVKIVSLQLGLCFVTM